MKRVLDHSKRDDITVTDDIKQDVDRRRDPAHDGLGWAQFPNVALKGFNEPYTLWRVEEG